MNNDIWKRAALGVAGELRVMSELLLLGFNVSKSYLDYGIDLHLDNGYTIQVKSGRKGKDTRGWDRYNMNFDPSKNGKTGSIADFIICWCVDVNVFYIIPTTKIKKKRAILFSKNGENKTYKKYKNAWNLLRRKTCVHV